MLALFGDGMPGEKGEGRTRGPEQRAAGSNYHSLPQTFLALTVDSCAAARQSSQVGL